MSIGTPAWIWSAVVDGDLYVRAYIGPSSRGYQAVMRERAGRIAAAGMTLHVTFEPAGGSFDGRLGQAYRATSEGSPYLPPMVARRARSATVEIVPAQRT